jgi:hypothetical protein
MPRRKRSARSQESAAPGQRATTERHFRVPPGLALFLALFSLYLADGRVLPHNWGGDTIPNRLIPYSLLRFGTATLEPFRDSFMESGGLKWYAQDRPVGLVSYYPIGTPLIALPFHIPVFVVLAIGGPPSASLLFAASPYSEKLVASAITALTVVLVWSILKRRLTQRKALAVAAVLGTCTLLWPVASQQLWQHGPGAMLLALGCRLQLMKPSWRRSLLIGLTFGALFAVRPQMVVFLLAAPVGLLLERDDATQTRWRRLAVYAMGALPPVLATLAYNHWAYELWGGGYQAFASGLFGFRFIASGVLGLLLSPNRGALVFMPVLVVGIIGAARVLKSWRSEPFLAALLVAAGGYFLIHAATETWAGGFAFGPRYLTELLPLIAICTAHLTLQPSPPARLLLGALIAWSFLVQLSGAYCYPASFWNGRMAPRTLEKAAWDWRHFMPLEDFLACHRRRGPY